MKELSWFDQPIGPSQRLIDLSPENLKSHRERVKRDGITGVASCRVTWGDLGKSEEWIAWWQEGGEENGPK